MLKKKAPALSVGLSPLARGTLFGMSDKEFDARFIPAGAGNTEREGQTVNNAPVYPRWRGEHNYRVSRAHMQSGLSPLARGTPV